MFNTKHVNLFISDMAKGNEITSIIYVDIEQTSRIYVPSMKLDQKANGFIILINIEV